jgi:hypothetical protein
VVVPIGMQALLCILIETRRLLALPSNDFGWSAWDNAEDALAELDAFIRSLETEQLPSREDLELLFAPTGSLQDVSINSGWAQEYLSLSGKVRRSN